MSHCSDILLGYTDFYWRQAMKKWITITLLLSLTLILFSQRPNIKPAKTLWKQGLNYFQRHNYKKALNNMNPLLKHYPRSKYGLEARIIKGKSHIGLRQYSKGYS